MQKINEAIEYPHTLRVAIEWRRFCLVKALESWRLGLREAKKESLYFAYTAKLNIRHFLPNEDLPF